MILRSDEVFTDLFLALYPRVRGYFLVRGTDVMTAEDLAQQVMLQVHQKTGEFQEPELFLGWVFAIARNELLQHWRRRQSRLQTVELEPIQTTVSEELGFDAGIFWQTEFDEWLEMLEPDERELVLLRFVEGLSYDELAVALSIPIGTVKSRIFYIKAKLLAISKADFQSFRKHLIC